MYHYVRPIKGSLYPKIRGLELDNFIRQLHFFKKNFNIITAEDLIDAVNTEKSLPSNSCLLTFDDGYKDNIDYVVPELLKLNLQGIFFPSAKAVLKREMLDVNKLHFILASVEDVKPLIREMEEAAISYGYDRNLLEGLRKKYFKESRFDSKNITYFKRMLQTGLDLSTRSKISSILFKKYVGIEESEFASELYLSIKDLKEMKSNGMFIGSHGYNHIRLANVNKKEQEIEIDLSLDLLTKIGVSLDNWIMCYPYGSYDKSTKEILASKKCALALTTNVGSVNLANADIYALNRFDTNDFPQ